MKRIVVVLFIAFMTAGGMYAQEIAYSGELRTGFYIEQETIGNGEPVADGGMTNTDGDSGVGQGRLRFDFHVAYQILGLRVRFQIDPISSSTGPYYPAWSFAYAYGDLFNEQLRISVGLLGESPWGTGGPNLRIEPESREYVEYNPLSGDPYIASEGLMGLRFEYKPGFIPGLNMGFVLNQPDRTMSTTLEQSFGDVLGESVVGIAYEHDNFAVRVGYRFDSEIDTHENNVNEGSSLTYRVEVQNIVDGMGIWLNGYYFGIGGGEKEILKTDATTGKVTKRNWGAGEYFINWLYWLGTRIVLLPDCTPVLACTKHISMKI